MPKTTEQHVIARSDKCVAYVTNNKRLCSMFCTIEANYWQTRSIAQPLCDSRATCLDQFDSAHKFLQAQKGHQNLYPLGRKADFSFLGKYESKTSYGNFSLVNNSYFVCNVTPYLQSKFGSYWILNHCITRWLSVRSINLCWSSLMNWWLIWEWVSELQHPTWVIIDHFGDTRFQPM